MASRKLSPFLVLVLAVYLGSCWLAFAPPARPDAREVEHRASPGRSLSRTALSARGGSEAAEDNDVVEVGGFSAFIVGLALLPFIGYAISTSFSVIFSNQSFALGPFGLELLSVVISLGVVLWSTGTFLSRGKGLPFGWLGLLGFAEGLSYVAALLIGLAVLATSFRAASDQAPAFKPSAPSFRSFSSGPSGVTVPSFQAPDLKMPNIKAPELPNIKAPELPTIKTPEIPAFKAPEIPTFKVPEIKVPASAPKIVQSLSQDDLFGSDEREDDTKAAESAKREEAKKAAEERKAEEAKKREEAKKAAEERKAEEARRREEAKKADEERKAEEARKREEAKKAATPEVKKAPSVNYDLFDL